MKARLIGLIAVLSLVAVFAGYFAGSGSTSANTPNIVLIYNGPSIANTHSAPDTAAFTSWCNSTCSPSVALPAYDVSTGQFEGTTYVWTKNFVFAGDGKSECFGEFVWFALNGGAIYADSGSNGTCGASIDSSLKQPTHITGPGAVATGGGDGTIVGGTGRFAKWTGTYTDRGFFEVGFSDGSVYYDQLFWSINRS